MDIDGYFGEGAESGYEDGGGYEFEFTQHGDIGGDEYSLGDEGGAFIEVIDGTTFGGATSSDGYVHEGKISLERTVSGITDTFEHYTKGGHDYVKVGARYIQVDSGQTVTINNVKYDTI